MTDRVEEFVAEFVAYCDNRARAFTEQRDLLGSPHSAAVAATWSAAAQVAQLIEARYIREARVAEEGSDG